MVSVYHAPNTRSIRVIWVLEEVGAPYELVPLAFPPRTRQPDYLDVNPGGTVPALVDGDLLLTDSMAICQYLAEKHGRADLQVAPGEAERPDFLQWLWFGEASAAPPLSMIARLRRLPTQEGLEPAMADAQATFGFRLEVLEARLEGRDYLAGGRFTLADVSVLYPLNLANLFGFAGMFGPKVTAYYRRLKDRPAYQRMLSRNA